MLGRVMVRGTVSTMAFGRGSCASKLSTTARTALSAARKGVVARQMVYGCSGITPREMDSVRAQCCCAARDASLPPLPFCSLLHVFHVENFLMCVEGTFKTVLRKLRLNDPCTTMVALCVAFLPKYYA